MSKGIDQSQIELSGSLAERSLKICKCLRVALQRAAQEHATQSTTLRGCNQFIEMMSMCVHWFFPLTETLCAL